MSYEFTTYDKDTGRLTAQWTVPELETGLVNVDFETEGMIDGHWSLQDYYRRFDGVMTQYPERPSENHVFNYASGEWYDPRTEQEKEDQYAEALLQARVNASLPKTQFLLRVMEFGILTPSEASAAARGEIPEPFVEVIQQMTPMEIAYLDIIWPSARIIERLDPFILKVAQIKQYPDELMDTLFGVVLPSPV